MVHGKKSLAAYILFDQRSSEAAQCTCLYMEPRFKVSDEKVWWGWGLNKLKVRVSQFGFGPNFHFLHTCVWGTIDCIIWFKSSPRNFTITLSFLQKTFCLNRRNKTKTQPNGKKNSYLTLEFPFRNCRSAMICFHGSLSFLLIVLEQCWDCIWQQLR